MAHVESARRLLDTSDATNLIYAALEIRMAIEEAFYALLPYYAEELPFDIAKRWQPRQVIDALLDCNPMAEQHQQVVMRKKDGNAVIFAGQQPPVTRKLLKQYYQKLGSYLHAPVDGKDRDLSKMKQFLIAALTRIEQHCRETTVIHNGGLFFHHTCICGRTIKRNFIAAGFGRNAQCPDPACRAIYDVQIVEGGSRWQLRLTDFKCLKCRVTTPIAFHRLVNGYRFTCIGCSAGYGIRIGPIATLRLPSEPSRDGAA